MTAVVVGARMAGGWLISGAPLLWLAGLVACETAVEIGPAQKGPGKITIVDSGGPHGDTGWWPSLTLDRGDRPHLSYCDAYRGDLRYATRAPAGAWRTEAVISAGAVGKYTAIAVDSRGTVGIVFYDQDTKYLRYAWRRDPDNGKVAAGWSTEKIAWGLEVGMAAELRFDRNDEAHLFYYVASGDLIHAHRQPSRPAPDATDAGPGSAKKAQGNTGKRRSRARASRDEVAASHAWHKEVIAEVTGGFSVRISPVLRPEGFWVSYVHWNFKDTTAYLARPKPGGGFSSETVASRHGPGWRSQLLFDDDVPAVIYSETLSNSIKIARRADDRWDAQVLLRHAANFVAERTAAGDVLLAYEDVTRSTAGSGTVKLLRRRAGRWQRYELDPEGPAGAYLTLAADRAGEPIVAYYSGVIRGLKVYDETR